MGQGWLDWVSIYGSEMRVKCTVEMCRRLKGEGELGVSQDEETR